MKTTPVIAAAATLALASALVSCSAGVLTLQRYWQGGLAIGSLK